MNDNINGSSSSSPSKKRKANDGRAATDCAHDVSTGNTNDGGGFFSSWFGYFSGRSDGTSSGSPKYENSIHQSLSQINTTMMRMEEKMTGMEEKLATVGNLERRCEELEKKCSSLENMVESTKEHIDRKCDSLAERLEAKVDAVQKEEADKLQKCHEFNEMMFKNQSWKYNAGVWSEDDLVHDGYTEEEAEYLSRVAEELKYATTRMRQGQFTSNLSGKGIYIEMSDEDPLYSSAVNSMLLPHWEEFAATLEQFTPAINILPDNCESSFTFYCVQLNCNAIYLIKEALIGKPFQKLEFTNNSTEDGIEDGARGGMTVDAILEIVESNKHLRRLEIGRNQIGSHHIDRLCSTVRNHPLVHLDLYDSFDGDDGDEMLTSLLMIDDLRLERLNMSENHITSAVSTLLADFLATNPRLKQLDLSDNNLNDSDAELIANSLRRNTTLRSFSLYDNNFIDAGKEALRRLLWDNSSLNAAADTNHCCIIDMGGDFSGPHYIPIFDDWNSHEERQVNRGRKIYHLLSSRNKTMSNAKYFENNDAKILPNMLTCVQKYHDASIHYDLKNKMYKHDPKVDPLSIVYEVMRKWDKAFPLYKTLEYESIEK